MNKTLSALGILIVMLNPFVLPVSAIMADEIPLSYATTQNLEKVATDVTVVEDTSNIEVNNSEVVETISTQTEQSVINMPLQSTELETTLPNTDNSFEINDIQLNQTYIYPFDNKVTIQFTKLPELSGNLMIREVMLTNDEIKLSGAVSEVAYEITSNMVNGTFEYNLTLPNTSNLQNAEVKYVEDMTSIANPTEITGESATQEIITIRGLDHFTVFFVVNPNPAGNGNASNNSCATATIGGSVVCYATIQAAINAAAIDIANLPHTINIGAGTFVENLVINDDLQLKNLTINGTGIGTTVIQGTIRVNGGVNTVDQKLQNFTLRGSVGQLRGLNLAFQVWGLTIDNVRFENWSNFALSLDNNALIKGLRVEDSVFINNNTSVKVSTTTKVSRDNPVSIDPILGAIFAPGTYSTGFVFIRNILDGGTHGIYVAGEENFIPSFGNPSFDGVGIYNSTFQNIKYPTYMEVGTNVSIWYNTFTSNEYGIVFGKYYKNGSSLNNLNVFSNTFNANGTTKNFFSIQATEQSISESGPTEGVGNLFLNSNTFNGALESALDFGSIENSGFTKAIQSYILNNPPINPTTNFAFNLNAFTGNTLDILYNIPTFNLDAMSTLSWSGGDEIYATDLVEARLVHDCTNSPFLHGLCDNNNLATFLNDFDQSIGSIKYTESVIIDLVPTVTISTTPGDSTTVQAITMTANILGGNAPVNIISWDNGNFAACTGTSSTVVTPALAGSYTCKVTVEDANGDQATAIKTVVVNPVAVTTDLNPTVIMFGLLPSSNSAGSVFGLANTNFNIRASLNNLGNPNYGYTFGGICSGTVSNSSSNIFDSNTLNLSGGNYVCTVSVTDTDGDIALASVPVIITAGGVGAPGPTITPNPVNGNVNSNTDTNTDGDVLGAEDAQTCTTTENVSGFVFSDTSIVNNRKDNAEDGIEGVELTIFVINDKNQEVEVVKVKTNSIGYWETNLCAGMYFIRINNQDLPDNTYTGGSDTFGFTVINQEDKSNVNFAVYSSITAGFNWWLILLIILLILLAGGGYAAYTTRKRNE